MRGREITEDDREGTVPVAEVSELFARINFGEADPVGRRIEVGDGMTRGVPRLIESFLYETKPNDPRAVALAATILLISALAAGYAPARRASRVDPLTALRHE